MLLFSRRAIDDVVSFAQLFQQRGNLLRGILKVIVDGYDHFVTPIANAAQERIVLSIIPHQLDANQIWILLSQRLDDTPTGVPPIVFNKNYFEAGSMFLHYCGQSLHKRRQVRFTVVNRDNNRHGGARHCWYSYCTCARDCPAHAA